MLPRFLSLVTLRRRSAGSSLCSLTSRPNPLPPQPPSGSSGAGEAVPVRGRSRVLRSAPGRKPLRIAAGSGSVSGGGKLGEGEDGGRLGREVVLLRAPQPGLGWAEARTAVGTALFPLPRPLGPPPLPGAVHRRPGRWPLGSGSRSFRPFPFGRWEAVSPPFRQPPSRRPALLGNRPVGISGLSRQSRVIARERCFRREDQLFFSFFSPPASSPAFLET